MSVKVDQSLTDLIRTYIIINDITPLKSPNETYNKLFIEQLQLPVLKLLQTLLHSV